MVASNDSGQKDGTAGNLALVPEHGLKKEQIPGALHRAQMASIEFAADLADAMASGWKSLRDQTSESRQVLDGSLLRGSVEAAATFLEGVAKATRRSYSRFQLMTTAVTPTDINYDKLAKLVAAELRPLVKP